MGRDANAPIYHNAPDFGHIFGKEAAAQIATSGWTVMNAPRPLASTWCERGVRFVPGMTRMMDDYVEGPHFQGYPPDGYAAAGIFWVAGPADAPLSGKSERTLADSWRSDDATQVLLINNAWIMETVRAMWRPEDDAIEQVIANHSWPEIAMWHRLPWRTE